jgi:hypothetical protein
MSIEEAVRDISYLQWSLRIGGIHPYYAKHEITRIMNLFSVEESLIIKQKVTEELSK